MFRDFPGAQWLRIRLLMQGTWVQFLVQKLRSHLPWGNWADASEDWAPDPQEEKPLTTMKNLWSFLEKACMQQWRPSTARHKQLKKQLFNKFPLYKGQAKHNTSSTFGRESQSKESLLHSAFFVCTLRPVKESWKQLQTQTVQVPGLPLTNTFKFCASVSSSVKWDADNCAYCKGLRMVLCI